MAFSHNFAKGDIISYPGYDIGGRRYTKYGVITFTEGDLLHCHVDTWTTSRSKTIANYLKVIKRYRGNIPHNQCPHMNIERCKLVGHTVCLAGRGI